ncbi:MAG: hypothetical protein U0793_25895 [Gemmataceae bacterium]
MRTASCFALWAQALWAQLDWELILLGLALLVALFAGYWAVRRVRQWRQDDLADRLTPEQQLDQYRELLDQGLLQPQEFERLKTRLQNAPPPDTAAQDDLSIFRRREPGRPDDGV